jgi:hypothetical protein
MQIADQIKDTLKRRVHQFGLIDNPDSEIDRDGSSPMLEAGKLTPTSTGRTGQEVHLKSLGSDDSTPCAEPSLKVVQTNGVNSEPIRFRLVIPPIIY